MNATTPSFAHFETPIGRCGVAWGPRGILAVQLPGTRPRAGRETPPPRDVRTACDAIAALLNGEPRDLTQVALDMAGVASFDQSVYRAAREIGPGQTLTYGELARQVDSPGEAREVGRALARNRFPIVVPCHRVVAAGGRLGGFSAPGGPALKRRLLSIENPQATSTPTLFDLAPAA